MMRLVGYFFGLMLSTQLFAFPCYIMLVKDSCWTDYDVTINIMDTIKDASKGSVSVAAGKSWTREKFDCEPKEVLLFNAKFTPVFWKGGEEKTYHAKRYWSLPESILPNQSAWTINLCYPNDFSEVPLPPRADNKCACNVQGIPEVKL